MPKFLWILVSHLLILTLLSPITTAGENNRGFGRTLDKKLLGLKKEKLTHFKVYWHDTLSRKNPSSVMIRPPVTNSSFFGSVNMVDNPLTSDPEINSKIVGRAQGIYASAAQHELGFLMVQNFAFTDGKYNGSTIAILGRNPALSAVREMPVVGGSGLFRFARGYVEARTKWLDMKTGDATVEYDCYVMHY